MKKLFFAAMSLICAISIGVGSASAARVATGRTVNTISSSVISIDLHDETTGGVDFPVEGINNVVPSQVVDKIVYVENTCEEKEWIRIKLTNSVISEDGKPLSFDKIKLNINKDKWIEKDGWYYYTDIVDPGKNTDKLFTTVTFDASIGNEYANSSVKIIVDAQAVQAVNNGNDIQNVLGWPDTVVHDGTHITSASNIKISAPVNIVASSVKYNGKKVNDGFEYAPTNTDMFQNFKSVMPGDTIAQDIIVKNDLEDRSIKIYMRAEPIKESDRAFLENMALAVYCDKNLISDANATELGGLKENVLLGTIAPGSTVTLTANLNVDIRMGNEFALKEGDIVWIFTIEECAPTPNDISNPNTGDDIKTLIISAIAALISGSYILYFIISKRKKKQTSDAA